MHWLTLAFLLAVALGVYLRLWLASRQARAVIGHRDRVPAAFADQVSAEDHRKAADYTLANIRFGRIDLAVDVLVLLSLTLGGGFTALDRAWQAAGIGQPWHGIIVILSILLLTTLINLPLSIYRTFVLEARFGFNRTTPRLFVVDLIKSLLLGAALGMPLLLVILYLMDRSGGWWWLYAWLVWAGFALLMTWAWPAFIAPLFNRFSPLEDEALKKRIEALLERCGFTSKGVYVMDGSRRTAHGNAYFTGLGRNKRIVFFDTLLERLGHGEIESVLAHELGHFRLRHVTRRLLLSLTAALGGLALLGWLYQWPDFYLALGVDEPSSHAALLLFMLVTPVFTFFLTPLAAMWSRRHEYQADDFAARNASGNELALALVKLHRDNASTLTPDPVYTAFYYSHPPAVTRIARLRSVAGSNA